MTPLTQERLMQFLRYEPSTGDFYRTVTVRQFKAGSLAGTVRRSVHITIDQRRYLAHRLVWLYVYGEFPKGDIDHIDGDPLNNRISNLRECNQYENQQNRSVHGSKRSKSGHSNVLWDKARSRWLVKLRAYGKNVHVGRFDSLDEALQARDEAKARFHLFQPTYRDALGEVCEVSRLASLLRTAA